MYFLPTSLIFIGYFILTLGYTIKNRKVKIEGKLFSNEILITLLFLMTGILFPFMYRFHSPNLNQNSLNFLWLFTSFFFLFEMGVWIITLFPLIFLSDNEISRIMSMIIFVTIGFGLSAALFYVDIIHGDVNDQDALNFGVKRAASYYGVNAFIHRFSTILGITTIAPILSGTGWSEYTPVPSDPFLIELGLKSIIFVFPAIALIGSILFFKYYDLHGEKLEQMREKLKEHPELGK